MKIDKNVPLPKPGDQRGKYPFRDMEIGDSFFVEGVEDGRRARMSARMMTRRTEIVLVTRSESGGVRIWRTA